MIASAAARSHATEMMRAITKRRGLRALAPHIERSWHRCLRDYGVHPGAQRATELLPAGPLREHRARLGGLLDIAHAELAQLHASIGVTGHAVVLADTDGTILDASADPRLGHEFRCLGLSPGGRWDERCQGTNGIGTCLAEGVPTTVHRGEHLCDRNVRLSGAGAPIVDARGKTVAVLCASSTDPAATRAMQRHTVELVSVAAALVSRHCFLDEFADAWVLRFHCRPEFVGLPQEALIAIDDRHGTILAVGESTLRLLGPGRREDLVGRPIQTLFDLGATAMHGRSAPATETPWPIHDVVRGRRFHARLRPPRARRAHLHGGGRPAVPRDVAAKHVATDPLMQHNLASGQRFLASRIPVLLHGAAGTGKDLLARTLHARGPWADRPFITVNCAAIPEPVLGSGLSGELARSHGRGDLAASGVGVPCGTLLLDEIGDLTPPRQAWLLRAIKAHRFAPADSAQAAGRGGWYVISASDRDLPEMVASGEFRADLYYRLAGAILELPALKDRSDQAELIRALLREVSVPGKSIELSTNARRQLLRYGWPGNIRQLRNALRTAAALCSNDVIRTSDLPREIVDRNPRDAATATAAVTPVAVQSALRDAECDALARVLSQCDWNVTRTARALAVSRNTLYRKLRKHGITPPGRQAQAAPGAATRARDS